MTHMTQARVAAGTGTLVRTTTALLYVVDPPTADQPDLAALFATAAPGTAASVVTEAAAAHAFDVPAFVVVSTDEERLDLVVFGTIDVHTDHPTLPMLSGSGSVTWVERRVALDRGSITVRVGADPDPTTDLGLGRVRSGGFVVEIVAADARRADSARADSPRDDDRASAPRAVPDEPTAATSTPAVPTEERRRDGMAALQAAMGHTTGAPLPSDEPETESGSDSTWEPVRDDARAPERPRPLVDAVVCRRGHPNPPHRTSCRLCADPIDPAQRSSSIRQPILATLRLPDGSAHPVDRSLVVGRRPDPGAARVDDSAGLVVVSGEPSISRTHLRIDVENWSLSVVDCGSRSGTALVVERDGAPRLVEPWVPHELMVGSTLYLGGSTIVVIDAPGDENGRSDG